MARSVSSGLQLGLAALPLLFLLSDRAAAEDGQWTPSADWGGVNQDRHAVHLALLPGDGAPYHSRVLWYGSERGGVFRGGEWGWLTGNAGCGSFPSASFVALPIANSGMDVFCSGAAGMADGRLLIAGGTDAVTGTYGENQSRILTPGSGTNASTWSDPQVTMNDRRWYGTVTGLRDGRQLIGGGSRHRHHRLFGGRRDGAAPSSPSGDRVQRFAPIADGAWEADVLPLADGINGRPAPRESHTFVDMGHVSQFNASGFAQVVYGGLTSSGLALDDTWVLTREDNRFGSDYTYKWRKVIPTVANPYPPPRRDHSAVPAGDSGMVVFGGSRFDGVALNDSWRLRGEGNSQVWDDMLTTGTPPSARFGHVAFADTGTIIVSGVATAYERIIVYGGVASAGVPPGDTTVYELRIDPTNERRGAWSKVFHAANSPKPFPRAWHTMATDHILRTGPDGKKGHATFLFGGDLGSGTFSDSLWILWTFHDGTVQWERKGYGGTAPSARARHSMVYDEDQGDQGHGGGGGNPGYGRLYIYGGENASGPVDRYTYVLDPWPSGAVLEDWEQWDDHAFTMSRHGGVLDRELTLSRVVEVFDPATQTFTQYPNHPNHWHHTYPLNFAVPGSQTTGGRVVSVGQDQLTYWLDIPGPGSSPPSAWSPAPSGLDAGFVPKSGVLYEPGKIMVAGGRTTLNVVTGMTKTLDMTAATPAWSSSGSMSARNNHNLVLLPTGQVLVVGGYAGGQGDHATAVKRPQVWTPSAGTWTPLSQLPEQPTVRGYHSTAILLPDGRVLSAGGEFTYFPTGTAWYNDQYKANIYCPRYLYKNDGTTLAVRPEITSAPTSMGWGRSFTVCTPNPSQIRRVALVRPGVTTHAFDENQRYVPLDFEVASNPDRLLVTGPASGDHAPPGYYMLFITGVVDGGETLDDVPSIARWVRVGPPAGRDTCDTVGPGSIGSFQAANPCNDGSAIDLSWTAPGDDGAVAASGAALNYEVRHSTTAPGSDVLAWFENVATPVYGPPSPSPAGSAESMQASGLADLTTYWFGIRAVDDNQQKGPISTRSIMTRWVDCGGFAGGGEGGGGGASLRGDVSELSLLPGSLQAAGTEGNSLFDVAGTDLERDALWLDEPAGGALHAWLRVGPDRTLCVDQARLVVVEHNEGARVVRLADRYVVGTPASALRVTTAEGMVLSLDPEAGTLVRRGTTLDVDLTAESGGEHVLTLDAQYASPPDEAEGIMVQVPNGAGYSTIARLQPRRSFAELSVTTGSSGAVRLTFASDVVLRSIQSLAGPEPAVADVLSPVSAEATTAAVGAGDLAHNDHSVGCLTGEDELRASFELPPSSVGVRRAMFVEWSATAGASSFASGQQRVESSAPSRLELTMPKPHPSSGPLTIEFTLPAEAAVRLEVFDLLGRRVAVLTEGSLSAGRHRVAWSAGRPGVYVCRLSADSEVLRKKIVVAP